MVGKYERLSTKNITLDMDNPRIAKFLEMYPKETLTG